MIGPGERDTIKNALWELLLVLLLAAGPIAILMMAMQR